MCSLVVVSHWHMAYEPGIATFHVETLTRQGECLFDRSIRISFFFSDCFVSVCAGTVHLILICRKEQETLKAGM